MTRPVADLVKHVWSGTGTGTIMLGAVAPGFFAFPLSLDSQVISYSIEHENGAERETGLGTYTHAGTTLSRDFVTSSTAGAPTKQSFTGGTKHVRLTALGLDVVENRAITDPGINDDISVGYIAGRSRWLNYQTKQLFFCVDHTPGAALWLQIMAPPTDAGDFVPTAIDLSRGQLEYNSYAQTGAITLALDSGVTPAPGGSVAVNIVGGGFACNFASPFVGLEGLTSGTILESGRSYPFFIRFAPDWAETSPGVFADRVLVGAIGLGSSLIVTDGGTFNPAAVDLAGSRNYDPYSQSGAIVFGLAAVSEVNGAWISVELTGDGPDTITYSADFVEVESRSLTSAPYSGFTGTRRLMMMWDAPTGKALVALSGTAGDGDAAMTAAEILAELLTVDGPSSGLDADLLDGQHASALLARANHTGAQAISTVTGLQTALDAKASANNPVFTGTVTVPDGALAIADTSGLQAALDAKVPTTRTEAIVLAASDETTPLTIGAGKLSFRMPYAFVLSAVRASVRTAPTGATLIVDVNEGVTSILSTKLSIDATEKTSTTAVSAAVISDTALADDAEITIDIDQVGSSVAGAGLKVYLIGTRP